MMRPSKPHGFLAWLFDSYMLSFALGASAALVLALLGRSGNLSLGLGLFAASLLASTAYHIVISGRVLRLSPGEMMAGRFLGAEAKAWLNPYSKSRWPVFVVMVLTVVIAANTWDGISDGVLLGAGIVAGRAAVGLAILYCLVLVGRGRPKALFPVFIYWAVMAAGSPALAPDTEGALLLIAAFGSVAAAVLALGILYSRWLAEVEEPPGEMANAESV